MKSFQAILFAAIAATAGFTANAQPANDEVLVGPVPIAVDALGTTVTTEVSTYFRVITKPDGIYLDARVIGNLKDAQAKFPTLIDKLDYNRDNCKSYKPDNIVPNIGRRALDSDGAKAVIKLGGSVEVWSCFENPIPATKLVWKVKQIGFFKTKVPVIETSPGSPLKTRTLSQSFDTSIPISLKILADNSVSAVIEKPSTNLNGSIASVAQTLAWLFGFDIDSKLKAIIDKSIDPATLVAAIPEEYSALSPKVISAQFSNVNGDLTTILSLSAKIPTEKINEFVLALVTHAKKK
ncbi:hypothetical protein [Zoogloea sp.]|uniref:hypothetical protein n=1 Tax=Zoogloea sp. TaxID=49181 RepID=UPI0026311245|nr:hypothetical protein [Zoogloea sp.]